MTRVPHDWKELYATGADFVGEDIHDARVRGLKHYKNICQKHGGVVFLLIDNSCPLCCKEARNRRKDANPKFQKEREAFGTIKRRAKERGIECTLTLVDIRSLLEKNICPVFGTKMEYWTNVDSSPSVDRFDPKLGYTKDNVKVVSTRANRIKSDGTIEEHLRIAIWMANQVGVPTDELMRIVQTVQSELMENTNDRSE